MREGVTGFAGYLCPACRSPVDASTLECAERHRYRCEDHVLVLLKEDFARELEDFSRVLLEFRGEAGKRILDPELYDDLPEGHAASGSQEWRLEWQLRCYDLELIRGLLADRQQETVLDVGSYNGWLANRLSDDGHEVTGVDYFADPHDGLRARKHYRRARWQSVQLDLLDLSVLNRTYDVVIANRCLQFFPDPPVYCRQLKDRVAPGGLLILTGLAFYRDPRSKGAEIKGWQRNHRERYASRFFLRPTRGYLDGEDRRALLDEGFELRPYPQLRRANLVARLLPTRPLLTLGVWQR